jgi:hypothetical protein
LCLENTKNVVALPVSPAATDVAPPAALVLDAWDRAVLAAATFPVTGPEIVASVPGKAASTARKRLKALTETGYLAALPRPLVTAPQTYQTTLAGRGEITSPEVGNIPDGAATSQPSDSGLSEATEQGGIRGS